MKKNKKRIILSVIAFFIFTYFTVCFGLYLFEPIYYNAPDLSDAGYSFDMYKKFSYEANSDFYIRQISHNDIISAEDDIRLKYVDDTILVIADKNASDGQLTSLFNTLNASVCGYIEVIDFYQITVETSTYNELTNICSVLNGSNLVKYAIVDYFEETPSSNEFSTDDITTFDVYGVYYEVLGLDMLYREYPAEICKDITVGVFDTPVYYNHSQLNVVNKTDYDDNILFDPVFENFASHGTHVAGIIAAELKNSVCSVAPGAKIYSENAINNSLSYWMASIANMIVNNDIKAINISMGYNSYIPVSASLGDEFAIDFVINANNFTEAFLISLLDSGYDFVICVAAGNETGTSLYKADNMLFGYGEKKLLKKLDIFNLFCSTPEYCDAEYGLCFNYIESEDVRNRIIVVGSCDRQKQLSSFSSMGDRVDIVAIGEDIYSTGYYFAQEYMSGTSMATPFVTGTAALLFALDENLTGEQVKDIIISSSEEIVSCKGFNYPILNIYNAVENLLNK